MASADTGDDDAALRADLRRSRLAAREAMGAAEHAAASAQIERQLFALLIARPAQTLAFCWPIRQEFDCRPLVGRLLAAGWQACQPVVTTIAAPMEFRAWRPGAAMASDPYGIPVPAETRRLVPDVILLPLVAFDERGFRLGYGGGYFDRTLAAFGPCRPYTIGVGFELARADSIWPQDHDQPLDAIVTERGLRQPGIGA